ncbi:hypothetical protein BASA81_012503 [Batrachochytrium salamandrivorans]|nr:hypothetical protein BASA81_012503 [Batrachochytrium salamandrivorans]
MSQKRLARYEHSSGFREEDEEENGEDEVFQQESRFGTVSFNLGNNEDDSGERRRALSASDLHDQSTDEFDGDAPLFRKSTPSIYPANTPSPYESIQEDTKPLNFGSLKRIKSAKSTLAPGIEPLGNGGGGFSKSASETDLAGMYRANMLSSSSRPASSAQSELEANPKPRRAGSSGGTWDIRDAKVKSNKTDMINEIKGKPKQQQKSRSAGNNATFAKGVELRERIFKQANSENQGLNPINKLYKPIFRKEFLAKHVNRLETSIKVITTQFAGDLFLGSKQTCEAVALDLDLLQFGGRKWGGGNGSVGEGIVKLDFVEIEALTVNNNGGMGGGTGGGGERDYKARAGEKLFWETDKGWGKRGKEIIMRKGRKSLAFWVIYLTLLFVLLTATLVTGLITDEDLIWDGLLAWRYFFFAFLFLLMPLLAFILNVVFVRLLRMWVKVAKQTKTPEQLQEFLTLLFVFEKLRWDMTCMLTFFLYTICFLVLFSQHPTDDPVWNDAYKYTTCVFGSLCVYFIGRVITQIATQAITRNVDVNALGKRVRTVLRREQALWEILQVTPGEAEESMFNRMEDPFVLVDPRMADHLAKGLIRTQFAGRYTKIKGGTVDICINTQSQAGLLGSWVYQSLMRRSTTSTRGTGLRRTDSNGTLTSGGGVGLGGRKRTGSGDSVRSKRIMDEEESVHQTPQQVKLRSSFLSILNEAKARHGGPGNAQAHLVYPELDLCTPFNQRIMSLYADAIDRPAFKIGSVRGCAKRNITINDVALCLERPEETLGHVWNEFLDCEHQGKVNLRSVRAATISLVSSRINLKATLESNAKVKGRLTTVLSVIVNFVVVLIVLAIFGLNVLELWLSLSSVVLAFSFIFGGTLKNIFDSVVFLFGVHPYDIGDKIKLGVDETPYWIDEIALMSTRMSRWDGASVEFLNSYLYTAVNLVNVNRSGNHSVSLQIRVDAASVPSKLEMDKIRTELEEFLNRSSAFTGECSITCREFIFPLIVRINVWFEFAYNDIDAGRTYSDTSKVIIFIISALKKRKLKASGVNSGSVDFDVGSLRLAHLNNPSPPPSGQLYNI